MENDPEVMTWAELDAKVEKEHKALMQRIKVTTKFITFDKHYHVELQRCDTHAKLLDWILHLNMKSWMTPELLQEFIFAACKANNLQINRHA